MPARTPLYIDTPVGQPDLPTTARDLRAQADHLQPGVVEANDLRVSVAGTTLTIQPDVVYVPDGLANPTLYRCEWTGAPATVPLPAPHATNARFDIVVARVRDLNVDGGTHRDWVIEVVQGTPVSTATLDNRQGAPDLPPRAVRLAEYVIAGNQPAISPDALRDRRPRARGLNVYARRTSGNIGLNGENTPDLVIEFPIETTGQLLRIDVAGTVKFDAGDPGRIWTRAVIDGQGVGGTFGYRNHLSPNDVVNGVALGELAVNESWWTSTLPAGRHNLQIFAIGKYFTAAHLLYANANDPFNVQVREIPGATLIEV